MQENERESEKYLRFGKEMGEIGGKQRGGGAKAPCRERNPRGRKGCNLNKERDDHWPSLLVILRVHAWDYHAVPSIRR